MLTEHPPYRAFNCITSKEKQLVKILWPRIQQKLEMRFKRKFDLDFDYNLYYNEEGLTKNEVLGVIGEVFKQYYNS